MRFEARPTFLGVVFDSTLTFRPQAEAVAANAAFRTRVFQH